MRSISRHTGLAAPLAALMVLVSANGCTVPDPLYCESHEGCPSGVCDLAKRECVSAPPDAAPECLTGDDCQDPASPICTASTCRPCRLDSECRARDDAFPLCASDGRCVACRTGDQCDSDVCDPLEGVCAAESDVLYVAPSGTDGACERSAPCGSIAGALAKIDGTRRYVHVAAGTYAESLAVSGETVTIVGVGAEVAPGTANTPGLRATDRAVVAVDGLTFRDGSGGAGAHGAQCQTAAELLLVNTRLQSNEGAGVFAEGCTATVRDSVVTGNGTWGIRAAAGASVTVVGTQVEDNAFSGLDVVGSTASVSRSAFLANRQPAVKASSGATLTLRACEIRGNPAGGLDVQEAGFDVENTFIVENGSDTSEVGGVRILISGEAPLRRFDFVTVAGNVARTDAPTAGVVCSAGEATTLSNSIVWGNTGASQVSGSCGWTYSNTSPRPPGAGNLSEDPGFVGGGDYHLAPGSRVMDKADPSSVVREDVDGDERPLGTGFDMGADEVVP